jgi:hypothetical protein
MFARYDRGGASVLSRDETPHAIAQCAKVGIDIFARTLDFEKHRSIGLVADPPAHVESTRNVTRRGPESHALNAAAECNLPALHGRRFYGNGFAAAMGRYR